MSGMSEGQESAHIDMAMSIVTYLFSDMESLESKVSSALWLQIPMSFALSLRRGGQKGTL